MKTYEKLSKQIDAMVEVIENKDMTADDATAIVETTLEWEKEYSPYLYFALTRVIDVAYWNLVGDKYGLLDGAKKELVDGLRYIQTVLSETKLVKDWDKYVTIGAKDDDFITFLDCKRNIDAIEKLLGDSNDSLV